MQELRKQIMNTLTALNDDWVEALKEGEKHEGVDLSAMFGKFSSHVAKIDQSFIQAQERSKNIKKGGFFQ